MFPIVQEQALIFLSSVVLEKIDKSAIDATMYTYRACHLSDMQAGVLQGNSPKNKEVSGVSSVSWLLLQEGYK